MTTPYPISVYDVRPEDHSSFQILPELGEDGFDQLQAFYNFQMDYQHGWARAKPGELFWSISGFELKAGPALLQPQVWDENGILISDSGILLFMSWPGADVFPPGVDPAYEGRGVAGFTENGSIGWGLGGESHIGEGIGGPLTTWASSDPEEWTDRRVGSDAVRRLGWWDDHIIPNPIFQVRRKGGSQPDPEASAYLVHVDEAGNITYHVPMVSGAPATGQAVLGLYIADRVVAHVPWRAGDGS